MRNLIYSHSEKNNGIYSIAILMACHNRIEFTIDSISNIFKQKSERHKFNLKIFLVDDGSTDGTSAAVRLRFPAVEIMIGDGNLYWNGAMRKAWSEALLYSFDFYLWLNDDTKLFDFAVDRLLDTYMSVNEFNSAPSIIIGSTIDKFSNQITYSGVINPYWWNRCKFIIVEPDANPKYCSSMNGNIVLIHSSVVEKIGILSPIFTHSMGDFEYGLRATKARCHIWVAPKSLGFCSRNPVLLPWLDKDKKLSERWKIVRGPKGLPFRQWAALNHTAGGLFWPLIWALPYLKMVFAPLKRQG